ncbi:MAG: leucine-rich repeat protein [Prevotella sp.]|nr:leucine-rich repeat protein [Prevotella sp.]
MRKYIILIAAMALLIAQEMPAQPINSAKALQNARDFLQAKGINIKSKSIRRAPSTKDTEELSPYYVFNLGDNEGFVIASGDDRAYPVLGYSDKGCLDLDNLPDNVKYWLDGYKLRIEALKGLKTTRAGVMARPMQVPSAVVEPMLTSKWDQGSPFNLSCPLNQDGRRCITGCVATAMAQVMYYHRRHSTRQVMEDIPGYYSNWFGRDSIHVKSVPKGAVIDWDNMLDEYVGNNYTDEQAMAVANLMLYCGTSVYMIYGTYASGASLSEVVPALVRYFDYDEDVTEKGRGNYSDAAWERMVFGELAKGNPVVYSGIDDHEEGHAFVVDGCDADGYVHVNWGWGGDSDGYFLLTTDGYDEALDGYSEGHHAIIGAVPNGAMPRLTTQNITLKSAETVEGLSSTTTFPVAFTMTVTNLTESQNSFKQAVGLYQNGQLQSVVTTLDDISIMAVNGSKTVNVSLDIDATLADGVYQLIPLSRSFDGSKWRKNGNYDQILTLAIHNDNVKIVVGIPEVEGDIITFADVEVKRLCVKNWDINGDGELSKQEAAAVTSLKNVFRSNWDIASFDELQYFTGLTAIDNSAFYKSYLYTVIIPPNVVTIGENAFYGTDLKRITIPAAVKEIGKNAFNHTTSLIDIQVEAGNTCYDSRNNCHALMETATNTLLTGCKNTVIPDGTKAIGEGAFETCSGLTTISIPNSVTSIGAYAFQGCYYLPSVTIPESVTAIGEKAFFQCNSLKSITIPKSIRTLAGSAFSYCKNLTSIRVDADNPYYDSRGNCNAVMEKATNKLVTGCQNTVIPQSTESIGDYAFYGCSYKPSVVIPPKVTEIGNYAFTYCKNICRVELPEGLKTIGEEAFYNLHELTTMILPSTVTAVGKSAFYGCNNLASVEARMATPINIETATFTSQNIATLYVPQGSASRYQSADGWKKFKKIVEGSIPHRDIIDFADMDVKKICINHWDKDGDRELTKEEAAAVKDLGSAFRQYSPREVEEEGEYNPYHPRSFDELQYFTGLTSIGNSAFYYSDSLRHVTLPPQVQTIGDEAFYMCEKLQAIDLPDGVTKIGNWAFCGCKSLTSLAIPEGVKVIDWEAFEYCSGLVSVSLPESLTSLGEYAFYDCNALTDVVVKRSEPLPIDKWTFSNYANATLYVPTGSRSAYMAAENWKLFGKIVELSGVLGDVNNDGQVNITDVTFLVNHVLGNAGEGFIIGIADINEDRQINVTDVTALVNIVLNNTQAPQSCLACRDDDHPHLIDLGLPSGTKWACCNVGSTTPEGYGGYYAWGETEEKSDYQSWSNYSHYDGTWETCHDLGDIAGTPYDVAHVKWGGKWQMPTKEQFKELAEQCTYTKESVGAWFEGPNGGKIFMASAGCKGDAYKPDVNAVYWSSTPDSGISLRACSFGFYGSTVYPNVSDVRRIGLPVRPVWVGR